MSLEFDYVIVGAGVVGAIMARYLGQAGRKVLVLDAGSGAAGDPATYDGFVDHFFTQLAKVPNSPYPFDPKAPSPSVLDITQSVTQIQNSGWFVPSPLPSSSASVQWFGSDYLRMAGGTMLHWLGTCLRMLPNDFRMASEYGKGVDWPIGYDQLEDDYASAEWEIGVSADTREQAYLGIHFPEKYQYPMQPIPATVVSRTLGDAVNGMEVTLGHGSIAAKYPVLVTSTPQGRNSAPWPENGYKPRGRVQILRYADHPQASPEHRPAAALQHGHEKNARASFDHIGERCEGNSSCIPICPVQAKYNPLKTLAWALRTGNVEVWPNQVVTRVVFGDDGKVTGVEVKQDGKPPRRLPVTAGRWVLALNSIENAKLMLASYEEDTRFKDERSQLGKNLMDHAFVLTWGESRDPLGTYRAPSSTAGIESLRDGAFRAQFGAFRIEVGNWGWDLPIGDPYSTTQGLINGAIGTPPLFGKRLRGELLHRLQRQMRLGALIEQLPDPGNRVTVSREWRDSLGEYRPVIQYGFTDYEIESFRAYERVSSAVFAQAGVTDRTDWTKQLPGQPLLREGKPVGTYKWLGSGHLVGTHRLASTADDGVVDTYQQSFVHPNLILAGGGSMRTIGTSNPSLTLVALTFRTLHHLIGPFKTEAPAREEARS